MKESSNRTKQQRRIADDPQQPACSGSSQEEVQGNGRRLDRQTGLKWMNVLRKKGERCRQERMTQIKEDWVERTSGLAKEFAKHKIDYFRDIYPPFSQLYWEFVWVLESKKAAAETVREYERWWKRYQQPVRRLTEENAPFSRELKEQIRETYAQLLLPRELKAMMLEAIRQNSWEKEGVEVLDRNIDKAPLKHPIWTRLQAHLFVIMLQKGLSETQTFRLLARLFRTLLPQWFDLRSGEDTIRLKVKKYLNAAVQVDAD